MSTTSVKDPITGQWIPSGITFNMYDPGAQDDAVTRTQEWWSATSPKDYATQSGSETGGSLGIESLRSLIQSALKYAPSVVGQGTELGRSVNPEQYAIELANQQQFLPQFQQLMQGLLSSGREADLQDVLRLSPLVNQARDAGERDDVKKMRDLLGSQVFDALASGESLTPAQQRAVEQTTRSSQMARGASGMGGGDIMRESVQKALEGQNLASQRRGEASNFIGSQSTRSDVDPFSAVLNSGGQSTGMALQNYDTGLRQPTTSALVPQLVGFGQQQNQSQYQAGLQANQMALMNRYMPMMMGM